MELDKGRNEKNKSPGSDHESVATRDVTAAFVKPQGSPYNIVAEREMHMGHLRNEAEKQLKYGVTAHPLHSIVDEEFRVGVLSRVQALLPEAAKITEADIFDARHKAVADYVNKEILEGDGPATRTFSAQVLKVIQRAFPNEPEAVISWGRMYFESLMGTPVMFHKEEATQSLKPDYEVVNSFVYSVGGEPVAIGGFYVDRNEPPPRALWGGRIAIAPERQGSLTFGVIMSHLMGVATRTVEQGMNTSVETPPSLSSAMRVFTTRADWNSKVIGLYESLGFVDTGINIQYNGLTEMIMELPNILADGPKRRITKFLDKFGS